jgi:nucleotide-binding universal stress UspA family protein
MEDCELRGRRHRSSGPAFSPRAERGQPPVRRGPDGGRYDSGIGRASLHGHDHSDHGVAFQDRFWDSLALALHVYSEMVQAWLGYTAPAFSGSGLVARALWRGRASAWRPRLRDPDERLDDRRGAECATAAPPEPPARARDPMSARGVTSAASEILGPMTSVAPDPERPRVLAGYDGSPDAENAIEIGARLLPDAAVHVVHLWAPPFASAELCRRLVRDATSVDELTRLLEREGAAETERVAAGGVALARAAGWRAEPLARRSHGGEGLELARLAEELRPAAVVVGSRGLSGARAVLGSVSDMVVHYSPVPVVVVPHPLLAEERQAAAAGPVVVGHDGSDGARDARRRGVPLRGAQAARGCGRRRER